MTREEALKIIKTGRIVTEQIRANDEETTKYNLENIEALNMAVEALEQESNAEEHRQLAECLEERRVRMELDEAKGKLTKLSKIVNEEYAESIMFSIDMLDQIEALMEKYWQLKKELDEIKEERNA